MANFGMVSTSMRVHHAHVHGHMPSSYAHAQTRVTRAADKKFTTVAGLPSETLPAVMPYPWGVHVPRARARRSMATVDCAACTCTCASARHAAEACEPHESRASRSGGGGGSDSEGDAQGTCEGRALSDARAGWVDAWVQMREGGGVRTESGI